MGRSIATDKELRAFQTDKAQEDVPIEGIAGLRVRVSKTGRKTFMYVYRPPGGTRSQRRITIGVYPLTTLADARASAKGYQGDLARRIDPQGVRATEGRAPKVISEALGDRHLSIILGTLVAVEGTFAHLATEYLIRHAWVAKKRTRDDESILRRDLIPRWGHLPASEIQRRDVVDLLDLIINRGAPVAARATKMLISKMYNFGLGRDLVQHNPAAGVVVPQVKARDTWLRDHEIRILWTELDRRRLVTASIFRAILLTLQRPGEVCSMEWCEVQGQWWEIPAEKTKNGRAQRVYLARRMGMLLDLLRPVTGASRYVFQSPATAAAQPITSLNKVGYSICKAAGISFTPHDLRRTGTTHLAALGFSDEVLNAVLNHKRPGIIRVYNHYSYDAEKREALIAWDDKVTQLVNTTS